MLIFDGTTYREMTAEELAAMEEENAKLEAAESHRPLTDNEVLTILAKAQINAVEIEDNISVRMISYYPTFGEIIGQTVKLGFKFTHENQLYKTLQDGLTIQAHYTPGVGTESLYARIDETYTGSKYDPIPYSGNMALEKDKYYTQNGLLYICIQSTISPVYHNLSELVGLYVELVEG